MSGNRFRKLSMTELGRKSAEDFRSAKKVPLTLILDDIRSAHNVGSIFRTADAFLIDRIILCGITAQPPHREILKSALGATETVSWEYHESVLAVSEKCQQQGDILCALEQTEHSTSLSEFSTAAELSYALVVGNEVSGVNQEVLDICDSVIEIPQAGSKHSLNVSVATGMVLWHFFSQIRG